MLTMRRLLFLRMVLDGRTRGIGVQRVDGNSTRVPQGMRRRRRTRDGGDIVVIVIIDRGGGDRGKNFLSELQVLEVVAHVGGSGMGHGGQCRTKL